MTTLKGKVILIRILFFVYIYIYIEREMVTIVNIISTTDKDNTIKRFMKMLTLATAVLKTLLTKPENKTIVLNILMLKSI